jgi:hypothetical protein
MKRRSGLYFWAILITSFGISVRQVGVLTTWLTPTCPWVIRRILIETGSIAMISGFSTVLVRFFLKNSHQTHANEYCLYPQYSRLGLIVTSIRTRRAVLAMMIINGTIWHTSAITMNAAMRYFRQHGQIDRP